MPDKEISGVPIYNYQHVPKETKRSDGTTEVPTVQWVVQLFDDVNTSKAESLCTAGVGCIATGHPTEGGLAMVEINATEVELTHFLALQNPSVESVEPAITVWKSYDIGASAPSAASWGLLRVQARARSQVPPTDGHPKDGGKNVHVYVLDTGIDTAHSDFGGRAVPTLDVTVRGRALIVCPKTDRSCALDRDGHGTHCAGTVGGGKFGIAKAATVHAVKVLGDDGSGSSAGIMRALDWVKINAIKPAVISMSLGGGKSVQENNAVDSVALSGVTVVVAAGNENDDACRYSPASAGRVISVGSTDQRDQRSDFSNYGKCVHILAPGSDIVSLAHNSRSGTTTESGTSMACPHVAGASALILGQNPSFTPEQIKATLAAKGTKGVLSDVGRGEPNLLLYTGTEGQTMTVPEPPKPTAPCHASAVSTEPSTDGKCACPPGAKCYKRSRIPFFGTRSGCPFRTSSSDTSFDVECARCFCAKY